MHILIVDDEPEIRATLHGLLEDQGYRVATCSNGEQAVELLQHAAFDLVLLDLWLPGIDGLEVLKRFNELQLNVATVVISAHAEIDVAVQATQLGAYNFLEKPLQPERVLLEVKNIAERLRLQRERDQLRRHVGGEGELVGESPAMRQLLAAIAKAAPSDARVLITGENGTGKELVAEAIHRQSQRSKGPFIKVNCAAIPRDLIESELFGHERGAFTGAIRRKIGLIEHADGGTLFLDEIGDMALDTQAKLLRVLQQNELMRVGGTATTPFNVRVISATNKNLEEEIRGGRFRDDLFFRLAVIPLEIPPLRERMEDLAPLANHFLNQLAGVYGRRTKTLLPDALALLEKHSWPGNIRELRNIVERLMIMNDGDTITAVDVDRAFPTALTEAPGSSPHPTPIAGTYKVPTSHLLDNDKLSLRERLEQFEHELLAKYFDETRGNVSEMARRLRTDRANLHRKLQRYRLK